MKFILLLFLFSFATSITNADSTKKKSSLFINCIQNADHPIHETGGPDWNNLNVDKAIKICKLAYLQHPNSIEIIRSLGRIHAKNEDYEKANELFLQNKNDPYSLWMLGIAYQDGLGVEKDLPKGLDYLKKSSSFKYPLAYNSLGDTYYYGTGVDKELEKSFAFYKLVTDQSFDLALNNVGEAYYYGEGVDKDLKNAYKYYKLVTDQGFARAQNNLGIMYKFGVGEAVSKDLKQAFQYFKLGADQGFARAQNNLGVSYEYGLGIEKDLEKAFKYFKLVLIRVTIKLKIMLVYLMNMETLSKKMKKKPLNIINYLLIRVTTMHRTI